MTGSRTRWIWAAIIAVPVLLLAGRWLAVSTADSLWAEALGVASPHAAIARLRVLLFVFAFSSAAIWCTGNLFMVYRCIGSVNVPRKLGNIEIVEALPRRYLLYVVFGLGLVLAIAMSHYAGTWWYNRALADYGELVGIRDPLLGRDASYYLFRLPWLRTLHSYVTLLTGVMLAVVIVLYAAVGALRWEKRRLRVNDLSRAHLGGLLFAFALVLFWGYRLEPVEYVAGIHNVPFDSVLADVRMPAARLLSSIVIIVALASAAWIWSRRISIVAISWGVLAIVSFSAHYLVPALTAAARSPAELAVPYLGKAQDEFLQHAYALAPRETSVAFNTASDVGRLQQGREMFRIAPIWDPFAVTELLNRVDVGHPASRFFDSYLGLYTDSLGNQMPVYVGVREADLVAASESERSISWEQVHVAPYSYSTGAVAMLAHRLAEDRSPLFVANLDSRRSISTSLVDVELPQPLILFGPNTSEYAAVVGPDNPVVGVPAGGFARRLAFAWVLQSHKLITSARVSEESRVIWHRSTKRRLEKYAPFATFGAAYPIIASGRLYWLADGYVSARAFPLSLPWSWSNRRVRYLRAGLIGVVDARTGVTEVYLSEDADPLSKAWAKLAPEIVRPAEEFPSAFEEHLRYPEELFRIQVALLRHLALRTEGSINSVPPSSLAASRSSEPFWWIGGSPDDAVSRLRIRAAIEHWESSHLLALVGGSVEHGLRSLTVTRVPPAVHLPGPTELAARFAAELPDEAAIAGPLKLSPLDDGFLAVQSCYYNPVTGNEVPGLASVIVGFRGNVASGPDLLTALERVRVTAAPPEAVLSRWNEGRRWFRLMETARESGDWTAFGEAYNELRRLLGAVKDSLP